MRHEFPIVWTDTMREFVGGLGELMGTDLTAVDPQVMIEKLGPLGRIVGATLRNTANPTQLQAGYKANVIPSSATAIIDCRVITGQEAEFEKQQINHQRVLKRIQAEKEGFFPSSKILPFLLLSPVLNQRFSIRFQDR